MCKNHRTCNQKSFIGLRPQWIKVDNSFKYAAKILKGKTTRSQSKQPVQKTLSMDVAMEHLKNNKHLIDVYDEKFKIRPQLPPKDKFLKYLKENLDKKSLYL